MKEKIVCFDSENIRLEGVLRLSDTLDRPAPCILLIHGSLEHDRDGNLLQTRDNKRVHKKNFFREISTRFCSAGYATFAWDRRGFGKSKGTPGNYFTESADAKSALGMLRRRKELDPEKIVVFGQSAGVYVATLLARDNERPALYILSGGLFRDYKEMMQFNFHRVRDYARISDRNLRWVEKNDLWGLAMGLNVEKMFQAIKEGRDHFTVTYKDRCWHLPIDQRVHAEEFAPKKQFGFIKRPTLIIHGRDDLNVPLQDAFEIESVLKASGIDVELKTIAGADHSFQQIARDLETRIRERISLASFKRPYKEEYFTAMTDFLTRKLVHENCCGK